MHELGNLCIDGSFSKHMLVYRPSIKIQCRMDYSNCCDLIYPFCYHSKGYSSGWFFMEGDCRQYSVYTSFVLYVRHLILLCGFCHYMRLIVILSLCMCNGIFRRHNKLVPKLNVGLKSLLHQGVSEPEFYGDLVYKFKKIRRMTYFSERLRKNIMRYKRIDYNLNVMRQSACFVINPITVFGYAALFNCTPVDRASDSIMAPT